MNAVSPGPIEIPTLKDQGKDEEEMQALSDQFVAQKVVNRFGTSDKLAKGVVFLASDESRYVTDIKLFADGGLAEI